MECEDLPVQIWLCRDELADEITPKYIYDKLREDDVIDYTENQAIDAATTDRAKNARLLDCVLVKSLDKVQCFLNAVREVYSYMCDLVCGKIPTDADRRDFLLHIVLIRKKAAANNDSFGVKCATIQELMSTLQTNLRASYCRDLCWTYPVPWNYDVRMKTNDIFSECSFSEVDALQLLTEFTVSTDGDYTKLSLTGKDSARIQRILLEGEPGSGKSMLCQKIALDWAQNPSSDLAKTYDLLLYFPTNTLDEYLAKAIKDCLLSDDVTMSITEIGSLLIGPDVQKKTLVIVDGYDELRSTKYVDDVWMQHKMSFCSMLVTSRPGFPVNKSKPIQAKYTLEGLTDHGVQNYINQYGLSFACKKNTLQMMTFYNLLRELQRNPLFLSLLSMVIDDNMEGDELPTSKTQLFAEAIEVCITRGSEKLKEKFGEQFDDDHCDKCVERLAKVAFESITFSEQVGLSCWTYEKDGIARVLCSMGLLVPIKSKKKLKPVTQVKFLHRVFKEYFAAKFLKEAMLSDEKLSSTIGKINVIQNQYVFVFLCGMFNEQREQINIVYNEIAKQITRLDHEMRNKCDFQEQKLGWHNPNHLLLECIGESGNVPDLNVPLSAAVPRCIRYNLYCKACLKGLTLVQTKYDVDCAVVVTKNGLDSLNEMENFSKFIVRSRSEKNLCSALIAVLSRCQTVKHLYVYLHGPSLMPADDHTQDELDRVCQEHTSVVQTLACQIMPPMGKGKSHKDMPKYLLYSLFRLINVSLKHLILEGCIFDEGMVTMLSTCLQNFEEVSNIHISRSVFDNCDSAELRNAFRDIPNLENIKLEGLSDSNVLRNNYGSNTFSTTFPESLYYLLQSGNLKSICIKHQKVDTRKFFKSVARNVDNLQVLSLHNVKLDFEQSTAYLIHYLFKKVIASQKLKQICLTSCSSGSFVLQMVGSMTNVEMLDISKNSFSSKQLCELGLALSKLPKLEELMLDGCKITDDSVLHLMPLLAKRRLGRISLAHNKLLHQGSIENLDALFSCCSNLKHITLSLRNYTVENAVQLTKVWNTHPGLETICVITEQLAGETNVLVSQNISGSVYYKEISPYRYTLIGRGINLHPYQNHAAFASHQRPVYCIDSSNLHICGRA